MAKDKGIFLDPACGSGVFLVRSFQRLCEHWRNTRISETIRWRSLLTILSRLNGWDLNSSSVRVAVFSLYVTLLEQVSPPDIRLLAKSGKLLPELWGKTLRSQDFLPSRLIPVSMSLSATLPGQVAEARSFLCQVVHRAFSSHAWQGSRLGLHLESLRHLRQDGIVAFLLPRWDSYTITHKMPSKLANGFSTKHTFSGLSISLTYVFSFSRELSDRRPC